MPKTVFQLALDSEEKVVHSLILETVTPQAKARVAGCLQEG